MKDYVLELDRPRTLRFGFKALRMIRQKFGERNLNSLMNINMDEIPALAFAGLKHEDKDLTVEKLEDLLDAAVPEKYTVIELTQLIIDALANQMGVDTKKLTASDTVEVKAKAEPKLMIPSTKQPKKKP